VCQCLLTTATFARTNDFQIEGSAPDLFVVDVVFGEFFGLFGRIAVIVEDVYYVAFVADIMTCEKGCSFVAHEDGK
jgi:hypothetical protein